RLFAASTASAVVFRNGPELSLRGCRLQAGAVGLSVEVGEGERCRVRLENSTITADEASGAALSLWSPEVCRPTPVELDVDPDTLAAGRLVELRGLPERLTVRARDSDFSFRDGLVGFSDSRAADGWRKSTAWHGRGNRYHAAGAWVRVEGRPPPVP